MRLKRVSKLIMLGIIVAQIVSSMQVTSAFTTGHWGGNVAKGAIVKSDSTPLVLEEQKITINLDEFPKTEYNKKEEFLKYSGTATIEYKIQNPTDDNQRLTLLLPLEKAPSYVEEDLYTDSKEYYEVIDIDKYSVYVDGKEADKELRYVYYEGYTDDEIKDNLYDNYIEDDFYSQNTVVTKYTYSIKVNNTDPYYTSTLCSAKLPDVGTRKLFFEYGDDEFCLGDDINIDIYIFGDKTFDIYVLGEPLDEDLEWTIYRDFDRTTESDATIDVTKTETYSLKDFLMSYRDMEYSYSQYIESDWYNACVIMMNALSRGSNIIPEREFRVDEYITQLYQYELEVEANDSIINQVVIPVYPDISDAYSPKVYRYEFQLSYGFRIDSNATLEAKINTPYYIVKGEHLYHEKSDDGYIISSSELKDNMLEFELCSDEEPEGNNLFLAFLFGVAMMGVTFIVNILHNGGLLLGAIAVVVVLVVVAFIKVRKKKNKA